MNFSGLWFGIGSETGGEIGVGAGAQTGWLFNYGDLLKTPSNVRYCVLDQRSLSAGVGLGGAASLNFLIGINAPDPEMLGRAVEVDWDFSLDLGLTGLTHYVRSLPEMIELAAVVRHFNGAGLRAADLLMKYDENRKLVKDAAEGLMKNHSALVSAAGLRPDIISLPLPLGWGFRVSLIKAKWEGVVISRVGTQSFVWL